MPSPILSRSRRDSWPPTQVRIDPVLPAMEPSADDDMDEDPLNYFLTPAPGLEDDLMDFDAGIEDRNHPPDIVRSVSPSSLDGLDRTKGRRTSPEPPELSDGASPYDDDSDEDYVRFHPPAGNRFGLPFSLRDFTVDGVKMQPRRAQTAPAAAGVGGDALLSPPPPVVRSPAAASGRGRSAAQGHVRGRPGIAPASRRRPQHVWREPSPDVWSIEEETTEDLPGNNNNDVVMKDTTTSDGILTKHVEVPAAKPKKKVRFVLPVKE